MNLFRSVFRSFKEFSWPAAARLVFAGLALAGSGLSAQQKLDTVKVRAEAPPNYISPALRGFEERRMKGMGKFISEKELRANDHRPLPDVLTKIPGIRMARYFSNTYVVNTRSGGAAAGRGALGGATGGTGGGGRLGLNDPPRACYAAIYVDGMRLYSGGGGEPPVDVQRLQVREYAGIEYYAGGASIPEQFNQTKGSDCGTLLLWTRER